jgi:hypothetical protein
MVSDWDDLRVGRVTCLYTDGAIDVDKGGVGKLFLDILDLGVVKGATDEPIQAADGVFEI